MKTQNQIEKELENVEFYLRTEFWEDWRVHIWEGYRDALQWALDIRPSKMIKNKCPNQLEFVVTSKDRDVDGIHPKYKINY